MKKILLAACVAISLNAMQLDDFDHNSPNEHYQFIKKILDETQSEIFADPRGVDIQRACAHIFAKHRTTKILSVHGQPVGLITFARRDPMCCLRWLQKPEGAIELLAVQEEHRGKGYAQYLINSALHELMEESDIEHVTVITNPGNTQANTLYEKIGFKECAQHPCHPKKFALSLAEYRSDFFKEWFYELLGKEVTE